MQLSAKRSVAWWIQPCIAHDLASAATDPAIILSRNKQSTSASRLPNHGQPVSAGQNAAILVIGSVT